MKYPCNDCAKRILPTRAPCDRQPMCKTFQEWLGGGKGVIKGVGKDAPTETTEKGGKHSASPYAFHLLDFPAMFALAKVLYDGAQKYPRDNWRLIECEAHLNHAIQHIFAFMAGDNQDDHLEHAFCRLMMAIATKGGTE